MTHRNLRALCALLALGVAAALPGCGNGTTAGAAIGAAVGAAIGSTLDEECDRYPYRDDCYYYKSGPLEFETPH